MGVSRELPSKRVAGSVVNIWKQPIAVSADDRGCPSLADRAVWFSGEATLEQMKYSVAVHQSSPGFSVANMATLMRVSGSHSSPSMSSHGVNCGKGLSMKHTNR